MKKIIIFGNTPPAFQSHFDFTYDSEYEVVAFTAPAAEIEEDTFLGLPLVPFEEVENLYPPSEHEMFIAIYFHRVNKTRTERFEQAKAKGYTLASYISSKAIVWSELEIGENCMICDGAIVRPFTKVGQNTFIMPGAIVGHNAVVDDHCYLAIRAVVLAEAKLESGCMIGANATILNRVVVGKDSIIGAGAVIAKNTPEKAVFTAPPPIQQPLPSNKMVSLLFNFQV